MNNNEWGGLQPRRWQAAALAAIESRDDDRGLVVAVMGAGKSVLLAELCARTDGRVIVTAPTLRLVHQLAATLERRGLDVGKVCTGERDLTRRVTVCTYDPRTLARVAGAIHRPALWIADEAHRTNTRGVAEWRAEVEPARSIGFTATPYLADADDDLKLWSSVWFHYSLADAVADGVILLPTFGGVRCDAEDLVAGARLWLADADGPGVFSAATCADADALAAELDGVESFHSGHSAEDRDDKLRRLEAGELRAIVHVACLVEGVDLPWLRWIGLTHPRGSRVAYAQEIGRVLRTAPGKTSVRVWDPFGAADVHNLHDAAALADALEEFDAPGPPALATMRVEGDQITAVFRHVADMIPADLLPLNWRGTVERMRVDLGDGDPITIEGGRMYDPRPHDAPGVRYVRHTLDIALDIPRERIEVIAPVVSADEALARSLVLACSVHGLCDALPDWVRARRRGIDGAASLARVESVRVYLRSAARNDQLQWVREHLPDGNGPALSLCRRILYDDRPPRVVTAYAIGLICAALNRDAERTNAIARSLING